MAELQDTDLMLVNRSGKSYKATGAEIKDSLNPTVVTKPQIIAPADGAGIAIGAESDVIIDAYGTANSNTYKWTELTFGTNSQISADGLTVTKIDPSGGRALVRGFGPTSGKWYYEARILSGGTSLGASFTIGWGPVSQNDSQYLCNLNNVYAGPGNTQSPTYTGTQTDWIAMCAIDVDAGLVWYGANGQWHKGENPADGVNTYWTWPKPDPSDLWVMKNDHSYNGTGSVEIQTSPKYAPKGFYGNLALVLASNKDFTGDQSFTEDDPVQQDSGYTPQTSAITGTSLQEIEAMGNAYIQNASNSVDGNLTTKASCVTNTGTTAGEITYPALPAGETEIYVDLNVTANLGSSVVVVNGVDVAPSILAQGINSTPGWFNVSALIGGPSVAITRINLKYAASGNPFNPGIYAIRVNGSIVQAKTILTLQDDTDLKNFREGDPIAVTPAPGSGTKGYLTPNPGGSNPGDMTTDLTYFWGNAFDGNPNTIGSFAQANLIGDPVTYSSEVAIKADGAGQYARINEGEWIGPLADKDWTTLATGSGVLHSLAITNDAAG